MAAVVEQAGWRPCGPGEWKAVGHWLTARALEHDTPSVLFRQALSSCEPALAGSHAEIVDETVRLFDMVLASTDGAARDRVAERQAEAVRSDVGRLALLDDILDVVLDAKLTDAAVGAAVRGLGPERLAAAARGDEERLPRDGGHLELMEARFSHVRSFAPQALAALTFASVSPSEVLDAVVLLQAMNAESRRHVPEDAPVDFVPARWRPYLDSARAAGDESRFKHYWKRRLAPQ